MIRFFVITGAVMWIGLVALACAYISLPEDEYPPPPHRVSERPSSPVRPCSRTGEDWPTCDLAGCSRPYKWGGMCAEHRRERGLA